MDIQTLAALRDYLIAGRDEAYSESKKYTELDAIRHFEQGRFAAFDESVRFIEEAIEREDQERAA